MPKKPDSIDREELMLRLDGRYPSAAARILGLPDSTVQGWVRGPSGVAARYCDVVRARFPLPDEDQADNIYKLGYNECLLDIATAAREMLHERGMLIGRSVFKVEDLTPRMTSR